MSAPPAAVLDAATAAVTAGVGSSPVAVAASSAASSVAPKSPSSTQADYGPTDPRAPAASSSPLNLAPSASPDQEPTKRFLYFAYGANMSPSQLKLKQVHSHSSRKGVLRDTLLLFDLAYASLVEPSYANLQRKAGAATHGVLYELETRDMEAMDRMEGNGRSYIREEFTCDLYPGEPTLPTDDCNPDGSIRVSAYICHPNNLSKVVLKDTPPSQRYLDVLIRGAKHHGIDSKYVSWLENHPSHPLPQLHFTAAQLAAVESRKLTQAELEAGCWQDSMDSTPMESWEQPLYLAIKGIVFDIRSSKYSNAWKKFNAGKCLTLFTAGRVASEDSSIPGDIADLNPGHQRYVDATVLDFMSTYPIVGHMENRGKYAW